MTESSVRKDPRIRRLTAEGARKQRQNETLTLRDKQRDAIMAAKRTKTDEFYAQASSSVEDVTAQASTYYAQIMSDIEDEQIAGTNGFQQLLTGSSPFINEVIACGALPRLVQLLSHNNKKIRHKTLWSLSNIAAGTHEHSRLVVECGAFVEFVRIFFSEKDPVIVDQTCWALGNLAGDCTQYRDMVLKAGVLPKLLQILEEVPMEGTTLQKTASWTLANLFRGKPSPPLEEIENAIPVISQLLFNADQEIEVNALWVLVFISEGGKEKREAVNTENVCIRCISYLALSDLNYTLPALRLLGNLISGSDACTQKVLELGILPAILPLLSHARSGIRKEAFWTLSNVLAGNVQQIQMVLNLEMFYHVLQHLEQDRTDVKKEAAWCVVNAVSGANNKQVMTLVQNYGVIPILCQLLDSDNARMVEFTIDAIDRVLQTGSKLQLTSSMGVNPYLEQFEEYNVVSILDSLQNHDLDDIFEKSRQMLETYFGGVPVQAGDEVQAQ